MCVCVALNSFMFFTNELLINMCIEDAALGSWAVSKFCPLILFMNYIQSQGLQ